MPLPRSFIGRKPKRYEKERLTDEDALNFNRPGTAIHDGGGLYLQHHKTGRCPKTWVFRWVKNKQKRSMGLGGYPKVSLQRARLLARRQHSILAEGGDPHATLKSTVAAANSRSQMGKQGSISDVIYQQLCNMWGRGFIEACFGEAHAFDPHDTIAQAILSSVRDAKIAHLPENSKVLVCAHCGGTSMLHRASIVPTSCQIEVLRKT